MKTKKTPKSSLTLRRISSGAATLVKQNLSWSIFLTSLFWFLLRTGAKPSRAIYPCQQAARANIFAFGLPTIASFWLSLKKCKRCRLKILGLCFLTLFLITGALGFTRAKTTFVSWFWQFKGLPKETQVLASTTSSRVVWVHDEDATNWDYGDDYFGREEYVDQNVVNNMTDQGLMALTGTSSVAEAWRELIPNYQPGQTIAIKVNLNSNWDYVCGHRCETNCDYHQLRINALPQPVNALIRGLKQIGVVERDIWVYEASKPITGRFMERITNLYPSVRFFDTDDCRENAGWGDSVVGFHPPGGIDDPPTQELTNVLVNADYLINMPIMKKHGGAGVTLSFKNHFGSIQSCWELHDWVYGPGTQYSGDHYSSVYNPLVEICQNPNIVNKTVLTVGDGLYGDKCSNVEKPELWDTFGDDSPNSLFFSTDPVAIDSVMYDFLQAEKCEGHWEPVPLDEGLDWPDDYLPLAEAAGLGVFEHGEPWRGSDGYTRIDFIRCEDSVCPGTPSPPPPTNTSTPTSTPTATAMPSSTLTATPSPTSTSSPTRTPTAEENFIYLPLIMKGYTL